MEKLVVLLFLISVPCCGQSSQIKDVFDVARHGSVSEMRALVEKNKDTIHAVSPSGFTPLILACYRGNEAVAAYLISMANNINYNSPNGTALAAVAVKGNQHLARLLLENHADPNLPDAQGMTPLHYAVQFKNIGLVRLLLDYRANKIAKDQSGKTVFEYAVFTKNQELINLLKQ